MVVLAIVYMFNFIDRQILAILLPAIRDEFLVSDTILGLLAGTAFALFYATLGVPIALLAAMYTSEFLHPRIKARVKPTIELMASLPSVVLGFLAALVFREFRPRTGSAPVIRFLLGMFAMLGALVFLGCPWRALLRLAGRVQLGFQEPGADLPFLLSGCRLALAAPLDVPRGRQPGFQGYGGGDSGGSTCPAGVGAGEDDSERFLRPDARAAHQRPPPGVGHGVAPGRHQRRGDDPDAAGGEDDREEPQGQDLLGPHPGALVLRLPPRRAVRPGPGAQTRLPGLCCPASTPPGRA